MNIANKQSIFLISGKAGVGKTSFAIACDMICKNMAFHSKVASFADEIKKTAISLGWDKDKSERGRKFLIDLGEAGRNYDLDMWSKKLYEKIDWFVDFVFVDDLRLERELQFFKLIEKDSDNIAVYTVRILSPQRESLSNSLLYSTETEIDLDKFDNDFFDYVIYNDGTLEDLYIKALDVIKKVKSTLKIW